MVVSFYRYSYGIPLIEQFIFDVEIRCKFANFDDFFWIFRQSIDHNSEYEPENWIDLEASFGLKNESLGLNSELDVLRSTLKICKNRLLSHRIELSNCVIFQIKHKIRLLLIKRQLIDQFSAQKVALNNA